ncbi:hypothetical protein AGMMS49944_15690 [Spirochaetia bacterium]|nr:hypothetical protein AGMMS49944_15690 [Spirochaetia bacterium]
MAKIIQFRLPPPLSHPYYERNASQVTAYGNPVKPPPVQPKKEAISISVMPDQAFPAGHQDFRPLLQRDGLILMSWARWEDWLYDGSFLRRYIVTWVSAAGGSCRHYAADGISEEKMAEAVPHRRADPYFYRGLRGRSYDVRDYFDKNIADYVYLTAPFDLTRNTVPGFIKVLKALGYTTDFDFTYTLTQERNRQSQAQNYLNNFQPLEDAKSL